MQSLFLLGRQPALGLAELESLYGSKTLRPIGPNAALLDLSPSEVQFRRLGGSIKLCKVLDELPSTYWRDIEKYLLNTIPKHLDDIPEGKFKLGISSYGLRVRASDINTTGLRLKKLIKAAGRSVRVVPNKSSALNSAQVLHNGLTTETGWELVCYRTGNKTLLCQTYAEQDITSYAARDQNRPKRDAKVGMLPPKLAQIIINLAASTIDPRFGSVILDPFCGTGVLLQEASLMNFSIYGTDIEPRMIDYTDTNLRWLESHFNIIRNDGPEARHYKLEVGDAATHTWQPMPHIVATETYLGKPLSKEPDETLLHTIMSECDRIHRGTLENLARQLPKGARLCLAVPAWRVKNGYKHLKTLDYIRKLGYTRMEFRFAKASELIYHREDQYVARELVVLVKN